MKIRQLLKSIGILLFAAGFLVIVTSLCLNLRQHVMRRAAIAEFKNMVSSQAFNTKTVEGEDEDVALTDEIREDKDMTEEGADNTNAAITVPSEGDILYMLRIPCIDSENPVREGVSPGVLADSLGHEPGTALIGEGGNCVIAGHRNYTFGSFFNRLNEVEPGDLIYVDTAECSWCYIVTDIKVVEPDDLSVLEDTDTETLTLYTCTPLYLATHRLVIVAKLCEVP